VANEIARKLRKTMTPQEVKLWVRLRELRALGHHFRRQSPVLTYIVDFECRRPRVVVEVDGTQHGFDQNRRRNLIRDENLRGAGYKILRFANPEIDRELDAVMETILSELKSVDPTRLHASRGATLPFGEG
jgi:very-short-patch-repair endonuclease